MSQHILPVPSYCVTTQTFAEHEAMAKKNGWCTRPGNCPSGIYYYPGLDKAPTWAEINRNIPVCASAEFEMIEYADWDRKGKGPGGGYGIYVKGITPDGEEVIVAHLREMPMVKAGDKNIAQGTQLGWMGSTGNSSGKHTHWEIRVNGIPVDPEKKLAVVITPPVVTEPGVLQNEIQGALIYPIEGEEWLVISDYVNKRSEPSTRQGNGTVIGRLENGAVLKPKRMVLYDAWLDLGDGYCAVVYQGNVYLARKS